MSWLTRIAATTGCLCVLVAAMPAFGQQTILRNPGFELLDGDGNPQDWYVFREAFADNDPALAHSGNRSLRASFLYGWAQSVTLPLDAHQAFAVSGKASVEFDFQRTRIRVPFFIPNGDFLVDGVGDSPVTTGSLYGDFWSHVEMAEGASQRADIFLASRRNEEWVRYDDLILFLESFSSANKDYGEPWQEQGGALVTDDLQLLLPEQDAAVSQQVVAVPDGRRYFVTGGFSATGPASLVIRESSIPRNENATTVTRSLRVDLNDLEGTWFAQFPGWTPDLSPKAKVEIENSSGDSIRLNDVSRGFTSLSAGTITVGPGSLDTSLTLTGAWPGRLLQGTIEIEGPDDYFNSPAITPLGTTFRSSWLDNDAPGGDYTARFKLISTTGATVETTHSFTVNRAESLSEPKSRDTAQFTNMAWLYLRYDQDDNRTVQTLASAKRDGFNIAMVHCRRDQLLAIRRACEKLRLPFIVQLDEVRSLFATALSQNEWHETAYRERLDELLQPVASSRLYRGVYIVDEPTTPEAFDILGRISKSLARKDAPGPAFSVLTDQATTDNLTQSGTPIWMVDIYPYASRNPRDNSEALLAELPRLNELARAADAQSRPFWWTLQAFESDEFDFFRSVPPAIHSAQLGAAVLTGARGVVPFIYTSISYAEGIRGPELEPTPKLDAYRNFARQLSRTAPYLKDLTTPILDERIPAPLAASIAEHPRYGNVLFLLNTDEFSPRTVSVQLSAPLRLRSAIDLVSRKPLPTSQRIHLSVKLEPGQWTMTPLGKSLVESYDVAPVAPPTLTTLSLPLLSQFTALRPDSRPLNLRGVEFDPTGQFLALSAFREDTGNIPPPIYRLIGSDVEALDLPPIWAPTLNGFSGDHFFSNSRFLGSRLFPLSNPAVSDWNFTGHSGGAFDLVRGDGEAWLTMLGYGVRQLVDTASGWATVQVGLSETDVYGDLYGPFAGDSVTAVVRNNGPANLKPLALDDAFQIKTYISRTAFQGSALSQSRVLALPRLQRGVALAQLNTAGETERTAFIQDDMIEAMACTWVNERLLAVADSIRNVRFYRVSADLSTSFIGTWRPPGDGHMLFTGLGSHDAKLALALFDGRVFLVDTSPLQE
ncbi:hypothetical protein CVU37_08475 [candidate division BRC1 bacterium HGW-BRC1-1]|jgi:hypothetical protein|nr:MAG: hypothetical protein CVU37_08475 [candidate division BRC1 bacterium HGW-BRC1-1]